MIAEVPLTAAQRQARHRARCRGEVVPEIAHRTSQERAAIKRAWERANRERIYAQQKVWRDAHRTELRERQAAMRVALPERNREYHKRYYDKHRLEIRSRSNAMTLRWRAQNPDKVREGSVRQRLRRIEATQFCEHLACLALGPVRIAWSVNVHRCYMCDTPVRLHARRTDSDRCEMDHVIPIARGGLHCAENLRPACSPCNRRKSFKLLSEMEVAA